MRSTPYISCAIAIAAALSLPALAQSTSPNDSSTTSRTTGTAADTTLVDRDDGFDWGWLGLIGLAGLIGLRKQPDVHRSDAARAPLTR